MKSLRESILDYSGILTEEENEEQKVEETSGSYLDDLKKLINAELVAEWQYELANKIIVGKDNLSYLQDEFAAHAKEEHAHFDELADALLQRGGKLDINLAHLIANALPKTEELTGDAAEYLDDFFIKAEDGAIKAYQEFYDKIEEKDKDLADIINGIISDEREHKYDLEKIKK